MRETLTIVGGSVAGLVATLAAARRGREVRLLLDPRSVGGSFAGVAVAGRLFDLGSRLFELAYEDAPDRPISAFDPERGTHRAVIGPVAALIREALPALRPAPTPEMWVQGRRVACPLMTVELRALAAALPPELRARIAAEPRRAAEPGAALAAASLAQHGPTLHRLLTHAVCAKQEAGWEAVLAEHRRALWAALFHPETVDQVFAGRPVSFQPHRPFSTTGARQMHGFVPALLALVQAEPRVTIVAAGPLTGLAPEPGGLRLEFAAMVERVAPQRCVLAVPMPQAVGAAGFALAQPRSRAAILWAEATAEHVRDAPSSLLVADPALPAFRISAAGERDGRVAFAVEFGAADPCPAAAAEALRCTGCVTGAAHVRELHRVVATRPGAPTEAGRAAFAAAVARLRTLQVELLAGLRRLGLDSLNDQIADGLHYGACRC